MVNFSEPVMFIQIERNAQFITKFLQYGPIKLSTTNYADKRIGSCVGSTGVQDLSWQSSSELRG
ncbi:MAG: hypothetical protein B6247_06505 [Candidatus Parabeggiatoa sp. nov. 2]|nr:MAG: hypothetical protein B6247_06505 [Beggiatoa sp. 4572_84]